MDAFFKEFLHSLAELNSTAGLLALANIIFIDVVMSGDNAILIGMATNKLKGKERKTAILTGIMLATLLRLVFASMAVYLMGIVGLKLAGGFLLLYVVWKFYKELRGSSEGHGAEIAAASGLMAAIGTIVIADVSMSLDNVLAVSGAAHGNMAGLVIGLIVSIVLMAFASSAIAKMLDKYPQIQWVGLIVILFVSVEMLLQGSNELENKVVHVNLLPFVALVVGSAFLVLQQKFLKPVSREKMKTWISDRFASVLVVNFALLIVLAHFGDVVTGYLQKHEVLLWSVSFALFLAILEVVSVLKAPEKKKGFRIFGK
ncbi:MAG: TerC family protein [Patescibacteria group bacterium]